MPWCAGCSSTERATGVEVRIGDSIRQFQASSEVVLSLGTMHTPKVLMLSGIGNATSLQALGIPVAADLPGVGRNFQNHTALTCVWETPKRWPPDGVGAGLMLWPVRNGADVPDCFAAFAAIPLSTPENIARYGMPDSCWVTIGAVCHPKSRGVIELTGADPDDPLRIVDNGLSHPDDVAMSRECIAGMREVGNSAIVRPFVKREVMPGDLRGDDLGQYMRNGAMSFFHYVGTARMGAIRSPSSTAASRCTASIAFESPMHR